MNNRRQFLTTTSSLCGMSLLPTVEFKTEADLIAEKFHNELLAKITDKEAYTFYGVYQNPHVFRQEAMGIYGWYTRNNAKKDKTIGHFVDWHMSKGVSDEDVLLALQKIVPNSKIKKERRNFQWKWNPTKKTFDLTESNKPIFAYIFGVVPV